jgi:uncharacterized protein YndB with AHSA1/START domain
MSSVTDFVVRRSITVDVPQATAFEVFVNMTAWWPLATHTIGEAPARASIVEPVAGGRWYDIDKNGNEHGIGHVLAYEPPERIVLSWEISHDWQYDPTLSTEIEVRFVAESPTRTSVELEHRHFERYGEHAAAQVATYEADDGWTYVLNCYKDVARHGRMPSS